MWRLTRPSITSWRMSSMVSEIDSAVHQFLALFEDDLALIVHHVIELEQVLADIEVARLDLLLGLSSALLIQGWTMASPSLRPSV
jgi:hypothetical protein